MTLIITIVNICPEWSNEVFPSISGNCIWSKAAPCPIKVKCPLLLTLKQKRNWLLCEGFLRKRINLFVTQILNCSKLSFPPLTFYNLQVLTRNLNSSHFKITHIDLVVCFCPKNIKQLLQVYNWWTPIIKASIHCVSSSIWIKWPCNIDSIV